MNGTRWNFREYERELLKSTARVTLTPNRSEETRMVKDGQEWRRLTRIIQTTNFLKNLGSVKRDVKMLPNCRNNVPLRQLQGSQSKIFFPF